MSRIFISHSSANNAEAIALRDWMIVEGWSDLFLDLDPDRGIAAGERWERALNEAARRCEAVLPRRNSWAEVSLVHQRADVRAPSQQASFRRPDPGRFDSCCSPARRHQHVATRQSRYGARPPAISRRAANHRRGGARNLFIRRSHTPKGQLQRAGLHASYFKWPPEHDPKRAPYRGLRPLEAEDAGILFGREAPIVEVIGRLRGLTEAAAPRLMVILGASGRKVQLSARRSLPGLPTRRRSFHCR